MGSCEAVRRDLTLTLTLTLSLTLTLTLTLALTLTLTLTLTCEAVRRASMSPRKLRAKEAAYL